MIALQGRPRRLAAKARPDIPIRLLAIALLAVLTAGAAMAATAARNAPGELSAARAGRAGYAAVPASGMMDIAAVPASGMMDAGAARPAAAPYCTPEEIGLLERVVAAEARGEPQEGQMAVCEAILNRAMLWDMTVGEVLAAPHQFAAPYSGDITDSVKAAVQAGTAGHRIFERPVTHFHSAGVTPYWAASHEFAGQIGNHRFYF
jgi:spore germination cell wall hydrolase CwlJ-like protein